MNKEEYTKKLIKDVVASIMTHKGSDLLDSIILTGSFGRGEPTWTTDENGDAVLKSDVEIALVKKESTSSKAVEILKQKVGAEFKEDLNLMTFNGKRVKYAHNYNYTFICPLKYTLFNFDFYNGSKTIWGHDYLKEVTINIDTVDPYEAKRIVANRIGELVYLTKESGDDYTRAQWKGKVMLAIGSAWLLLNKKYSCGYHAQRDAILKDNKIDNTIGAGFSEEFGKVFGFLRDSEERYEVEDDKLRQYVGNINNEFKRLGLNKSGVNNVMRIVKYALKYIPTGCKFGIFNFENNILSSLISQYADGIKGDLCYTADVWHKCIY